MSTQVYKKITGFTTKRGMPKASQTTQRKSNATLTSSVTSRLVFFVFFLLVTTSTRHSHIVAPMFTKSPLVHAPRYDESSKNKN